MAHRCLLDDLAQLKMLSGLALSHLTERRAFDALSEGRWRKHLKSLRERLGQAHQQVGHSPDERVIGYLARQIDAHVLSSGVA